MRAQTKENVVMADELLLSQEDETHSTHPVAQFAVVRIIFHGDLGLKRRLLKA